MTGYRCTMNGGFRVSAMSTDTRTYFWTAEQTDATNAPFVEIGENSLQAISYQKSIGLCVRCIMDEGTAATGHIGSATEFILYTPMVSHQRQVTVQYEARPGNLEVQVVDILGRTLYSGTWNAATGMNMMHIDLSHAAAGTYLLRMSRQDEMRTQLMQLF